MDRSRIKALLSARIQSAQRRRQERLITLYYKPVNVQPEFRILGRLEALADGEPLALGSLKQRAVLALLLINANEVVSTDRILDELWGEEAAGKQNTLWVFISQLRSALEPEREPRAESSILISRSPGYVLKVEPEQVDARWFEEMLTEGRGLLERDPRAASLVLGEALALWRGKPLEDFMYEEFAQREIARLEELRIEAVEERIEADLRGGEGADLVGELEALAREHPLRERITGQLMLALYRAGRQAEALRAYRRLEERLGEELGIAPSPQVRQLEEQIVMQDPALLSGLQTPKGPVPGLTVRGYELREEIGRGSYGAVFNTYQPSVGREVAIKVIRPELADDPDFIRRFEAEAALVADLEHPRIVPLYDYWREPGAAYLVMRLMKGGSLASVLGSGPLPTDRTVRIVSHVAEALAAAHRHGVVHRDVKPNNILLDRDGNAYLADFGIAGTLGDHDAGDEDIRTGGPYSSPELEQGMPVSVTADIYSLGMVLREAVTGRADADPETEPGTSSPLLDIADRATAPSAADRYPDVDTLLRDLTETVDRSVAATPSRTPVENPYKGLRAFREADAEVFFGRDRVVERLVSRMGSPGLGGRFTALVGPSGSGKSSVVKAGLLPALRRGAVPGSQDWFIAEMAPGAHPFEELESSLTRIAVDPPSALLEQLQGDDGGLRRAATRLLPDPDSQLLLVIDQFEELFTQTDSDRERRRFLDGLHDATSGTPNRIRVLATLRADFYDRPLRHQPFAELLREGTEVITPMTPEELERAITGPAEAVGAALEPGLAAAVVADVVEEPGALPLLQYAMTEVFEQRDGTTLTTDTYHELGGVAGALGRRAEALYRALDEVDAAAARQVFLRLMSFGEGGEEVRQKVLRSELRGLSEKPGAVDRVLDTYGRHRLLSFDRDPVSRAPTVELAHEALLTAWPRYREWVEETRSDVQFQRRLAVAAVDWRNNDEEPGYLLTGPRLTEAETWRATTELVPTELEDRFIAESSARAAENVKRRRRRRRLLSVTFGAVAAVALALVVFAVSQRSAADRLDAVGDINRLIEAAEDSLESDPELALLLATAAAEETDALGLEVFPENLEILHQGLRNQRLLFTIPNVASVVFSPEANIVYAALTDGTISLRDATTGVEVDRISPGDPSTPLENPLAITEDGRWLTNGRVLIDVLTGDTTPLDEPEGRLPVLSVDIDSDVIATTHFVRGADGRDEPGRVVVVRDRRTLEELWSSEVTAPITLDLSPDGSLLAVANSPLSRDYSVIVFDVADGDRTEIPLQEETLGVEFHPSGDTLLLGGQGIVRYWDVDSQSFLDRVVGGHARHVGDLDFDTDVSIMASGDATGNVIVRDASTGGPLYPLLRHRNRIIHTELSADGSRLATVTAAGFEQPGALRVFDTSTEGGRDLVTIDTGMPLAATVDVDPAGTLIAVGDHLAGMREVWGIVGEELFALPPHQPLPFPVGINGPIAISPDGTRLVTGDAVGAIRIWDAGDGSLMLATTMSEIAPDMSDEVTAGPLGEGGGNTVFGFAFSPDGTRLAVAGAGFVLVADAATLDEAQILRESPITFSERVAFSPDGGKLLAGIQLAGPPPEGFTNPVTVWDLASGDVLNTFPGGVPGSPAVDYSPTGDLIAVGSAEVPEVTILDAETFEVRHVLQIASPGIFDLAFNPTASDNELAIGYQDGTIVIWDAAGGAPLYSLPGHGATVADLDWTADGTRLVSVGFDGTVRVYVMNLSDLLELVDDRVTRTLTDQECRQYLESADC